MKTFIHVLTIVVLVLSSIVTVQSVAAATSQPQATPQPVGTPTATPNPAWAYPPPESPTHYPPSTPTPEPTATPEPTPIPDTPTSEPSQTPTPETPTDQLPVVSLPEKGPATIEKSGGVLEAWNGKLHLTFPKDALPEAADVSVEQLQGADQPPISLSGNPFRILAQGKASSQAIHKFSKEIKIELAYEPASLPGEETSLTLYYYDVSLKDWIPLRSQVDPKKHILTGFSDHLTDFNIDLMNWQAARLPSMDAAQVSTYTGAATYSYPIQVPEGPGGLKPSLSLSYNSQVVDGATIQTQASLVGMGWSLDTGYIERNMHGTNDDTTDDTFSIVAGGISSMLLPAGDGYYHTTDESFWRIKLETNLSKWTAWDKNGNVYTFADMATYPSWTHNSPCDWDGYKIWRWSLTSLKNKYGQELTYNYYHEQQWGYDRCNSSTYRHFDNAVYPATIVYPSGRYQIRFDREDRYDYSTGWTSQNSWTFYQKYRLKSIFVENDADGNGSFETVIRRIALSYETGASAHIFSSFDWSAGAGTATLVGLREYGKGDGSGDTNALPPTTFTYDDLHLHLKTVTNGYGGKVEYTYESSPWYQADYAPASLSMLEHFGSPTYQCSYNGHGDFTPDAPPNACSGGLWDIFGEVHRGISARYMRPGGKVMIKISLELAAGRHYHFGLRDDAGNWVDTTNHTESDPAPFYLDVPATFGASNPRLSIVCDTACSLKVYDMDLVVSRYRVTQKKVYESPTDPSGRTFSYSYGTARTNNPNENDYQNSIIYYTVPYINNQPDPSTCTDTDLTNDKCYFEAFSEFRGHDWVSESGPDGRVTKTWFYQDVDKAGRAYKTEISDSSGKIYSLKETTWVVNDTCDGFCSGAVLPHLAGETIDYVGVKIVWIYVESETSKIFESSNANGPWIGTKLEYIYDKALQSGMQYGNLTNTIESTGSDSSSFAAYRATWQQYYPYASSSVYLTGLIAFLNKYYCDSTHPCTNGSLGSQLTGNNATSSDITYYDANTTFVAAPTAGILAGKKLLLRNFGGYRYNDETYSYDAWGNRLTVTQYPNESTMGVWPPSGNPATDQLTTTNYDTVYHTYVASQANALSHSTVFINPALGCDYDYALGLPQCIIDPNGAKTTATYDNFGRLISTRRPGDENGAATMQIEYYVTNGRFWTEATQKVDSSQTFTVRKFYNGLGELIQTQQVGVESSDCASSPCTIVTNQKLTFSAGQQIVTQTAPYAHATESDYINPDWSIATVTTNDVLGRPLRVTAPWQTNSTSQDYSYSLENHLLKIVATDSQDHDTITYKDARGRVTQVVPPTGPGVTYTYTHADLLEETDYGGAVTHIDYDLAGRKTAMNDPDMGDWSYGYDALNLTTQTDARGCTTSLSYDLLNRLTGKTYSGSCASTPTITNTYDARFQDPFDGTSLSSSNWTVAGGVTVSNGQVHLTANNEWGKYFYRSGSEGTFIDGHTVSFAFRFSSTDVNSDIYVASGPWQQAGYRTWGISIGSGLIRAKKTEGTTATYMANLTTFEANTWYEVRLVLDAQGNYIAKVWKQSNPAVGGQVSEYHLDWETATPWREWDFYDTVYNGQQDMDYYSEQTLNGIGRRVSAKVGTGSVSRDAWVYDARGRVQNESAWIDNSRYTTAYTYNSADLVVNTAYPDGEVVTNTYLPQMALNAVSGTNTYVQSTTYDVAGRTVQRTLGSGNTTNYTYYAWNQQVGVALHTITTSGGMQSLTYSYSAAGNITQTVDGAETLAYSYDSLNRLTGVSNAITESYTYNATTGNLANKGGPELQYNDANHTHAVTNYNGNAYTYDQNGNQTGRIIGGVNYALVYDGENRLVDYNWVDSQSNIHHAYFSYDADGKRVKVEYKTGVTTTAKTIYVGGIYEKNILTSEITKYYRKGATLVGMRRGATRSELLTDNLGSVTVSYSVGGNGTYQRYYPWGAVRSGSNALATDYTYTGQKMDSYINLMFYKARYYDVNLGRFIQADVIIPSKENSIAWDRYAYSRNNPVVYNDSSGLCSGNVTDPNNPDSDCWNTYFELAKTYTGIDIVDPRDWTFDQLSKLKEAMEKIVNNDFGGKIDSFLKAFGGLSIENAHISGNVIGMVIPGMMRMLLWDNIFTGANYLFDILHEFGHAFDFNKHNLNGANYFSQEFIGKFNKNPHCDTGMLGCLPDPSLYDSIYYLYNLFSDGSSSFSKLNSYNPSGTWARSYSLNSSIDDYADTFAVYTLQAASPFTVDSARLAIVQKQTSSFR